MREEVPESVRPWLWLVASAAMEQSFLLKRFSLILVREEVPEFVRKEVLEFVGFRYFLLLL